MMNMDLSRVMDAYRGQEDKLRQRVQLSNDLLELIAYEQLTREKRQLMAAQQAKSMPPGGLPTVKDQKEQEAFDLTKQEIAQQVGKTFQQQEAMRQQAMRQGVAAAPGAQNVMPQQAMAAGGIVAFDDGGPVQAQYSEAELPNAPGSEPSRSRALSAIAKMDDATVTATASKLVGAPIDSPTQARITLAKMFGDQSIDVGMSGALNKVTGMSLGASTPMLGGTLRAGMDVPRGGRPAFSLGYNRQFDRGGIVAFNGEKSSLVEEDETEDRRKPRFIPQGRSMRRLLDLASERQAILEQQQREAAPEAQFGVGARPPAPPPPEEDLGANVPRARETSGTAFVETLPQEVYMPPRARDNSAAPPKSDAMPSGDVRPGVITAKPSQGGIAQLPSAAQVTPDLMKMLEGTFASSLIAARANRDTPQLRELSAIRDQLKNIQEPTIPQEITRAREADQKKLEEFYRQTQDPEKQRINNLIAFLAGGAGRRGIGSVLGGAAEAGMRSQAAQEAAGLQALKDVQTGRETLRQAQLQQQQAQYAGQIKRAELGGTLAKAAADIEANLNIRDQDVNRALAEQALQSMTRYGSDLNKIAADIQAKAAELGVSIDKANAQNITQIVVARIGAEGAASRSERVEIDRLVARRADLAEKLADNEQNARKDPLLNSALSKPANKRSQAEQSMVDDYEARMGAQRQILKGLDDRLAELRGQPTAPSAGTTGSAASQGIKVTGATAPR